MKLPFEPLMDRKPYLRLAYKKVEQRRSDIETSLKRSKEQHLAVNAAITIVLLIGGLVWLLFNFFYGLLWAGILWIICLAIFMTIAKPKKNEEGVWKVSPHVSAKGWSAGSTVEFVCKRIVADEVIETIIKK